MKNTVKTLVKNRCLLGVIASVGLLLAIHHHGGLISERHQHQKLASEYIEPAATSRSTQNLSKLDYILLIIRYKEDISWANVFFPFMHKIVYQIVDDAADCKWVPYCVKNFKDDTAVTLKYILDNYENLPRHTIIVQGHRTYWHEPDIVEKLVHMRFRPDLQWANTKEMEVPQGEPQSILNPPDCPLVLDDYWKFLAPLIGKARVPLVAQCCSQFIVHRDRIQRLKKSFWQNLYAWRTTTNHSSYCSGRALEWSWHVLLGEPPVSGRTKYCDMRNCSPN